MKGDRLRIVAGAVIGGLTLTATAMLPGFGLGRPGRTTHDSTVQEAEASPVEAAPDALLSSEGAGDSTAAASVAPPRTWSDDDEAAMYRSAADAAFAYLRQHKFDQTGLVRATEFYDQVTAWDIGSLILGLHAAGELELASAQEIDSWLRQVLETLGRVRLFDGGAYNKVYVAGTGEMVGETSAPSTKGRGWSAIDLGRLLIALKVVEQNRPALAELARSAANRIDWGRTVKGGYIQGADVKRGRTVTYPEGRFGYEQYGAMGFALWGHEAANALDTRKNSTTVEVMGERIPRDKRGTDRLTSEPVVLMGLEVGWTPEFKTIAGAMLRAQEARYKQTGKITIASEDAVQTPPHYFYYYTFWSDGKPFAVRAMGAGTEGPRWVSAKGAYAWHSLMPTAYTWSAVGAVEPARSAAGWSSGVYEENGKSTEVRNLNTAGVILQAALYRQQGRPPLGAR